MVNEEDDGDEGDESKQENRREAPLPWTNSAH